MVSAIAVFVLSACGGSSSDGAAEVARRAELRVSRAGQLLGQDGFRVVAKEVSRL